jgi:hypothetical protein
VIFGSDYQGDLMPDLRFGGTLRNQLVVIDPATLTITYQASLSGSVVQAVELPYGIAFETAPIHTLAASKISQPLDNVSTDGIETPDSTTVGHSSKTDITKIIPRWVPGTKLVIAPGFKAHLQTELRAYPKTLTE